MELHIPKIFADAFEQQIKGHGKRRATLEEKVD
jgi:hypothetical protein